MFKEADKSLGLARLIDIKNNLDRIFGKDAWVGWEIETISFELKVILDELTKDKIGILQVMAMKPDLFFHDSTFFLHTTEVINNKVADFDSFPFPTSLELAYAIEETKFLNLPIDSSSDVVDIVSYILREEGYSKPVYPFNFIPESKLEAGQTDEDIEAKKKAIYLYINHMNSL
jgi:hypothetical protein